MINDQFFLHTFPRYTFTIKQDICIPYFVVIQFSKVLQGNVIYCSIRGNVWHAYPILGCEAKSTKRQSFILPSKCIAYLKYESFIMMGILHVEA